MRKNQDELVNDALSGDRHALEEIINHLKDLIYNLSLKMLLYPEDAQDATQDILIRVVTHLSTFKGESELKTWAYRIATNYLLTAKKKVSGRATMSFDQYAEMIDTGQSNNVKSAENEGELRLLEEEVKVSCTHGLLMCLSKTGRIVYILGDILEISSTQGAEILDMTPANFRKHLSRSRDRIRNFLQAKCGIVDAQNPCRCTRKIDFLATQNMIDPKALRFATHTSRSIDLIEKINTIDRAVAVFRSVPVVHTPAKILNEVRQTIDSIGK